MTTNPVENPTRQGYVRSLDGKRQITLEEFDRMADEGSDEIDEFLDWSQATRPGLQPQPVHFAWPAWMVAALDHAASKEDVTPEALVQRWVAEKLEAANSSVVS